VIVLGVDPGLTTTGFGLVRRDQGLRAVAAGVIRTDKEASLTHRLLDIHRGLAGILEEHQPQAMVIEQVFTNKNLQTAIGVGRASGVAILAAAQYGLEVFEYAPTMVKAAITGDGAANKKMVAIMVGRRLGISPPHPVDAADALAVAICHLQSLRLERVRA
jgi:crossover junction endodeoxyribonuclease RuvC